MQDQAVADWLEVNLDEMPKEGFIVCVAPWPKNMPEVWDVKIFRAALKQRGSLATRWGYYDAEEARSIVRWLPLPRVTV